MKHRKIDINSIKVTTFSEQNVYSSSRRLIIKIIKNSGTLGA
jgi:hypothetical protein